MSRENISFRHLTFKVFIRLRKNSFVNFPFPIFFSIKEKIFPSVGSFFPQIADFFKAKVVISDKAILVTISLQYPAKLR